MHISRLALDHYRSWSQVVVDFVPGVNILFGKNGLGKTNLVEAVEVLSTGSSHRTSSTLPLIERGQTTATIRANVADDAGQTTTYEASIHARGANRARINSGSSLYLRDIIGKIPSVSFTPEDQRLVSGDPGARRVMMNQAAALLEPGYMQTLQQFTRIAKQRATLLKQLNANANNGQPMDAVLSGLEIWTGQFIEAGVALTRMRAHVIGLLAEPFAAIYADLAGASHARVLLVLHRDRMRDMGVGHQRLHGIENRIGVRLRVQGHVTGLGDMRRRYHLLSVEDLGQRLSGVDA